MSQRTNSVQVQPEQALLKGTLAGFVATLPMTIFMLATQRFLPKRQQYRLPRHLLPDEGDRLLLGIQVARAALQEILRKLTQRILVFDGRRIDRLDQPRLVDLLVAREHRCVE